MNELEAEYVDILKGIRESAGEGKEFVVQQAPLAAMEYVTYCRYVYTSSLALSCLMLSLCVGVFLLGAYHRFVKYGQDGVRDDVGTGRMFLGAVGTMIFSVCVFHAADLSLKAWVAPRVLIMEKAVDIVNGECR